jgi:DNA replication protein DnaC
VPRTERVSATQGLEELLGIEVEATWARRQRGRLRFPRYPVHKTLAGFDFDFQPGVDSRVVAELSTLRFVEEKRNVILLGRGQDAPRNSARRRSH